jgi:hypothetical protein
VVRAWWGQAQLREGGVLEAQVASGDGETITLKLAWAGKARQQGTMDRRNADKLNAARGYKE